MKKFIGGALAVIIGLSGFSLFFSDFYALLTGIVPILLILGGGLAFYLGYEDIKADDGSDFQDTAIDNSEPSMPRCEETASPLENETKISPPVQTDDKTANETAKFMGNTDTFVFHSIDCNFSKGKKCTQGFTNRDEALKQGYKPCKVCSP